MYRLRMTTPGELRHLLCWLQRVAAPLARRGHILFLRVDDPACPSYLDVAIDGYAAERALSAVLADKLARYIWGHWQFRRIWKQLADAPEELAEDEIQYTAGAAYRRIQYGGYPAEGGTPSSLARTAARLCSLLTETSQIDLDGFLRFRCRDLTEGIKEAVRDSIDDYLINREYDEFVDVLRYFLNTTPVTPGTVYVVCKSGCAVGLEGNYSPIDVGMVERVAHSSNGRDLHPQDVLVSALITRSPERLVIATRDPGSVLVQTLARVFAGRAEVWTDGPECDHLMAAVDNAHFSQYTSV